MVEKGVVIGEMGVEQQIPDGNDRKKSKGNGKASTGRHDKKKCKGKGNDTGRFVVFHPSHKNKCVARMGHPRWFLSPGKTIAKTGPATDGDGVLVSVGKERYRKQP
jgi:hypothetical protein